MWQLIAAVILWAFANIFFKIARESMSASVVLVWQAVGIVIASSFVLILTRAHRLMNGEFFPSFWAFCGGAASIIGAYYFLESLGALRVSIAVPFAALHIALTCILGFFFLKENMSLIQMTGVITIIIGSMMLGISSK